MCPEQGNWLGRGRVDRASDYGVRMIENRRYRFRLMSDDAARLVGDFALRVPKRRCMICRPLSRERRRVPQLP